MIKAEGIYLTKGGKPILQDVSLSLRPGEVLALIGANGAGKSSLLRVLAGEEQSSGRVSLNGKALPEWRAEPLARLRAVLSQQLHLPFAMSVLEVVLLGRYPYSFEEPAARSLAIARDCLQQLGLSAFEQRNILTLSGGEQQRVHFARVLAQLTQTGSQARYLLLDEPTASLDLAQQHRMLPLLRRIARRRNIGVLVILHDMNLAARYADRILLLRQGQLLAQGCPASVLTADNISRGFGLQVQVLQDPACPWPQLMACPSQDETIEDFHHS